MVVRPNWKIIFLFLLFCRATFAVFTFTSPLDRQIYQRSTFNLGTISVSGSSGAATSAQVRATPISTGVQTAWTNLTVSAGTASGNLSAAAGWYSLEVKLFSGVTEIDSGTLDHVGIGDVFITAGQSNATNYYTPLDSTPPDDRVNCRGTTGANPWRRATDPQPTADNINSSVWPKLGDLLVAHTGYPVGFISVGAGNTQISQWTFPGTNYSRITAALGYVSNPRAILWHQGENDGAFSTSQSTYATALKAIIDRSRIDAGTTVPWGIAVATHPNEVGGAGVILAQIDVGTTYLGCFQGANTDTLNNTYRTDTVHFNSTTGRDAHALLWYNAILSYGLAPALAPVTVDTSNSKLCFWNYSWLCVTLN